jgi:hypothetical protein
MISKPRTSVAESFRAGTPIDRALHRGARAALLRHKLLGQSIVVWRDGHVAEIPANQIIVPLPVDDDTPTPAPVP